MRERTYAMARADQLMDLSSSVELAKKVPPRLWSEERLSDGQVEGGSQ